MTPFLTMRLIIQGTRFLYVTNDSFDSILREYDKRHKIIL
jgi:hypothetical protein